MKAMILAAGRGERMRPLTDEVPKPLLSVGGKPLIVWNILRLAAAGITEIVINHAWLGNKLELYLGNGAEYGVNIYYSREHIGLETAGGIATAMPLLGEQTFLLVNGDVLTDVEISVVTDQQYKVNGKTCKALLMMVSNPDFHVQGDFYLSCNGLLSDFSIDDTDTKLTYSGLGLYHPSLFASVKPNKPAKLAPILKDQMRQSCISGFRYQGLWLDVGTVERLKMADGIVRERWGMI